MNANQARQFSLNAIEDVNAQVEKAIGYIRYAATQGKLSIYLDKLPVGVQAQLIALGYRVEQTTYGFDKMLISWENEIK